MIRQLTFEYSASVALSLGRKSSAPGARATWVFITVSPVVSIGQELAGDCGRLYWRAGGRGFGKAGVGQREDSVAVPGAQRPVEGCCKPGFLSGAACCFRRPNRWHK